MAYGKKNSVNLNPLSYNICLLGESKCGKEQPVTEPVLAEFGWKPIGTLKIGDQVYGEDGNLHKVTGIYPQGIKDVYEVTFRDGSKTRCGLEHLWRVSTIKQRDNSRRYGDERFKVIPLSDILKDYRTEKKDKVDELGRKKGEYSYKYSIPINKPIKYDNQKELNIPPYALGLLLGDGGFTQSTITFTNAEQELLDDLEHELKGMEIELHCRDFESHKQASLTSREHTNLLKERLSEYGLLGCSSRDKFIPSDYKYSSIENRARLLSGIINTDGSVCGKRIVISTYSLDLANDILDVARSLGFIATKKEYDRTNKDSKDGMPEFEYGLSIISEDYSLLNLSTKHLANLQEKKTTYTKSIINIEKIGKEESICIMVDNPSHLYITNDFIVTHNTTLTREVCEKLVGEKGYLFLEIGLERGADAIEGINYINTPEWSMDFDDVTNSIGFKDVCDDIIENKLTEYPNLKVVMIDTYDQLINIAEKEVLRIWNKECRESGHPEKCAKTINGAFGGFGKGEKKAIELMFEYFARLKNVGVSTFIIGHVKTKDVSDVVSGTTYQTLTSDQQQNYFNALKKNLHFLGLAYIDRTIITEKTGRKDIKNKDITKNVIKEEVRRIKFRDDNYAVDSGSRFADIIPEIPMSADAFIEAMMDAIKKEKAKSGLSEKEIKKQQKERDEAEKNRIAENDKKNHEGKELNSIIEKIMTYCIENKTNPELLKPVLAECKSLGYPNPKEITSVGDAKKVFALIEQ